jgi:hypothetical protein
MINAEHLTHDMFQYVRGEKTIGQIIDEQPKIDIDKAMERLKSKSEQCHDDGKFYYESGNNQCAALSHSKAFAYEDAIEIIKSVLNDKL